MSEQTSCALPRAAAKAELHPWDTTQLDIAKCDRTEIVVPLYEHETAGTRPETWPDEIRRLIFKYAEAWVDDNKTRAAKAVTYGLQKHPRDRTACCVMIIHHSPRGA